MGPQEKLFFVGFGVAIAVEVVRWYQLVSSILHSQFTEKPQAIPDPAIPPYMWLIYVLLTGGMASLGGLLAVIYKPVNLFGAFYLGVTAPLIITQAAHKVQKWKMFF